MAKHISKPLKTFTRYQNLNVVVPVDYVKLQMMVTANLKSTEKFYQSLINFTLREEMKVIFYKIN